MSNISNRHQINLFVSGKSEPLSNQRLAKVGYKSTKKTPAKFPSVCVSVPPMDTAVWNTPEILAQLADHVNAMIETAQDGIIKSLYESSNGNLSGVNDDEIGIAAVIQYLNAEATGDRLTIESIGTWFDSVLADNVTVVFAEKLGFDLSTPEQELTVKQHLNAHRSILCSLSGGKTVLQPIQIQAMEKILELTPSDSDQMCEKLIRVLQRMKKPTISEFTALL